VVRGWFQVGTTLRTFVKLAVRSEAMNSTRKPQTQAVERIEARANEDGKKSPTTMPRGILYQIQFWKGGGGETYVEFLNILPFYLVDFILMFTRPCCSDGGCVLSTCDRTGYKGSYGALVISSQAYSLLV